MQVDDDDDYDVLYKVAGHFVEVKDDSQDQKGVWPEIKHHR
jgi:hypothetical protein